MIPTTHRLFAVISGESTSLKKLHQTANLKRNKKTSSKPAFWIQAARFFGSKPFKLAIFWNWTQRLTFFEGIKPCLKPPSGRLRVFSAPVGFAMGKARPGFLNPNPYPPGNDLHIPYQATTRHFWVDDDFCGGGDMDLVPWKVPCDITTHEIHTTIWFHQSKHSIILIGS